VILALLTAVIAVTNIVARMERSEIRDSRDAGPDCAEPVIGRRFAPTRCSIRAYSRVICPSGGLLTGLSSLFFRIFRKILVPSDPNQI